MRRPLRMHALIGVRFSRGSGALLGVRGRPSRAVPVRFSACAAALHARFRRSSRAVPTFFSACAVALHARFQRSSRAPFSVRYPAQITRRIKHNYLYPQVKITRIDDSACYLTSRSAAARGYAVFHPEKHVGLRPHAAHDRPCPQSRPDTQVTRLQPRPGARPTRPAAASRHVIDPARSRVPARDRFSRPDLGITRRITFNNIYAQEGF